MGRLPPNRAPGRSPRRDDERLLDRVLRVPVQSPNIDGETGAYTVRFRHYDPTPGVARWLERDPAGYVDGPSLYGYLGRSPVDGMDPPGLKRRPSGQGQLKPPGQGLGLGWIGPSNKAWWDLVGQDGLPPGLHIPTGCGKEGDFESLAERATQHNSRRREQVGAVGGAVGVVVEVTVDMLPGGGAAGAFNDLAEGNYIAAGMGFIPGDKLVGGLGSMASKRSAKMVDPSTPIGRRGNPLYVPRGTNAPTTIGGREFSGHSIDQMQSRGIIRRSLRTRSGMARELLEIAPAHFNSLSITL
jgi:RHS repeat-associated protein